MNAKNEATMERCKTCKHWGRVKEGEYGALPGTGACKASRQIFDVTESKPPDYDELQLLPALDNLIKGAKRLDASA